MDALTIGLQALEAAMHAGTVVVGSIDQLAQAVTPMAGPELPEATCDISECTW
ncbi:MAG: hypothetical protein KKH61_17455 [Gammaproteobacteria bacterium]|uniref:hypothetical protein n=1 Tax=Stenotrophomonas TaxID=40323 RepID=UPI0016025733|nr:MULTISPECIES: hypothetical protein [Stenotrophomonas]MBU2050741.1 hypothetical protein [Gammaproteobacteria bacterium]